ncbi:hypothetical protein BN2497_3077 [Janthinobacterium sp. CG23_2]|nr:hypothetical protein BN2497_3077 [Janthinobacterium sp. CG23_2]CUU27936.1 hypothetical protein BN3177_3077 [Janthinobacterium sp. CG23_2]
MTPVSTFSAAVPASLAVAVAVAGIVALQGWRSLNLVRQQGRRLLKIDKLEQRLAAAGIPESPFAPLAGPLPGSSAPAFSAVPWPERRSPQRRCSATATRPCCDSSAPTAPRARIC